jgi:hypothetical protein
MASIALVPILALTVTENLSPEILRTGVQAVSSREAGELPTLDRIQPDFCLRGTARQTANSYARVASPLQTHASGSLACPSAGDYRLPQFRHPALLMQPQPGVPIVTFLTGTPLRNPNPKRVPPPPRAVRDCFVIHGKQLKLQETVPRGENSMGSPQVLNSYNNRSTLQEMALPASASPGSHQAAEPAAWRSLWPQPASPPQAVLRQEAFVPRCSEKGCVFPASADGLGQCVQHRRQSQEPNFFSSLQPTRLVLERAKFGLPETEVDTSRTQDRRRLANLRQAFLED